MATQDRGTIRSWRRFIWAVPSVMAAVTALYLATAVAIDPYDTGRSTLLSRGAVRPQGPRTAVALRGRDMAYSGAIIGNSHIQLIAPTALSQATGIPFVQLSVPATGPAEQFAVLDWFLAHHPAPEALVLSADAFWCGDDPTFASEHPFPYWLLGDWPSYLRGLLRLTAAQETAVRIGWLLNPRRKAAAADGWWNYEANYLGQGFGRDPALVARLETRAGGETAHTGPFPIAGRFREALAAVPATTSVVLVFPPVYHAAEPPPGSPRAEAEAACRQTIRDGLAGHRRSAVVDWRNGRRQSRDPALFFDQSHYRLPIAEAITGEVAGALNRLKAGASP